MAVNTLFPIFFILTILVDISFCVIVSTMQGNVRGEVRNHVKVFLGIPYAEPPVRRLRWRSPREKVPWTDTYDATYFRPKCPQASCAQSLPDWVPCSDEMSEDCLHLNIYVPKRSKAGSNLAVLIYLHGGFYSAGTASDALFNGEVFVKKGRVILVTINYRLGVLGSLATGRGGINGNYGVEDQRMAMKWVYDNIYNFGGDREKITLFGQSAGGQYVAYHLANRKADEYFRNAIIMSAPIGIATKSVDQAISIGASFSQNLNCNPNDRPCLRSKTVDDVIASQLSVSMGGLTLLQGFVPFEPYFDNDEVLDIQDAFKNGLIDKKDVVFGVTTDENEQFTYNVFPNPVGLAQFESLASSILPDQTASILQRYVPVDVSDARQTLRQLIDDVIFICPTRRVAINLSAGPGSVWFYVFENGLDFLKETNLEQRCQKASCHENELPFLFQSIGKIGYQFSFFGQSLANALTKSWTDFAKTGCPSSWRVRWKRFRSNARLYKLFKKVRSPLRRDFRGQECSQFDQDGFNA